MLAIYCRTSKTKEEGKDYSIAVQKEEGVKFAVANGFSDYEFYVDEGISGTYSVDDRPDFGRMFEDIRANNVTAVYCYDQSRIERDTSIWAIFSTECILQKCKFFPEGKECDMEDPTTMLSANILSSINAYYAQITSKKVKQANLEKAKKGKTHGLKPYGFSKDSQNNYQIKEDEAKFVQLMYDLSLKGVGTYQIADILNKQGVPTRMNGFNGSTKVKDKYTGKITHFKNKDIKWRGNTVHGILTNPINKGHKYWNGEFICELPVKIIDEDKWQKVQDNLAKNKKEKSGRRPKYNYLLNGISTCYHCGNKYVGKRNVKINDNTYKCKGRREKRTYSEGLGISIVRLENAIIRHLFYSDDLKDALMNAPRSKTKIEDLKNKLVLKKKELDSNLKAKKHRLTLMLEPEFKDDDDVRQAYLNAKKDVATNEAEIESLEEVISELENDTQKIIAKSAFETFTEKISFDDLKTIVHQLIKKIDIRSCKEWSDELQKDVKMFQIFITYKHNDFISRLFTDRFAKQWVWRIEGHKPKEISPEDVLKKKKRLDEEGISYNDFSPEVDGETYHLGTLTGFTLPDIENLLQYN